MLVIKQLLVPIDFNSISFPTLDVSGNQQLFSSSEILQSIFFLLCSKGLEGHEWVNDDKMFILG